MIPALLLSFGVVFLAEFGDKSQLMTLTFALRYRWQVVLAAIATATAVLFGLSVTVGHFLGNALPAQLVTVLSGVAFVIFGLWTLRGDGGHAEGAGGGARAGWSAFVAVASAFLIAELGDRTMFSAIALATNHHSLGVWLGSTLAMIIADGLALVVGLVAGKHLPTGLLHVVSAYGFLFMGSITLAIAWLPTWPVAPLTPLAAAPVLVVGAAHWAHRRRRVEHVVVKQPEATPVKVAN
jgi:Ca2+/H+ antiporter, TMEM165/GDT1 family